MDSGRRVSSVQRREKGRAVETLRVDWEDVRRGRLVLPLAPDCSPAAPAPTDALLGLDETITLADRLSAALRGLFEGLLMRRSQLVGEGLAGEEWARTVSVLFPSWRLYRVLGRRWRRRETRTEDGKEEGKFASKGARRTKDCPRAQLGSLRGGDGPAQGLVAALVIVEGEVGGTGVSKNGWRKRGKEGKNHSRGR